MLSLFPWRLLKRLENSKIARGVRGGLIAAIPILTIGSFAIIVSTLPIPAYQQFLQGNFIGQAILYASSCIHLVCIDLLSIFMTICISVSYSKIGENTESAVFAVPFTAVVCFAVLTGMHAETFVIADFGARSMFTAIFCAIVGTEMYNFFFKKLRSIPKLYAEGVDLEFNQVISTIMPSIAVIAVFTLFNYILIVAFGVSGFQQLFYNSAFFLFRGMGRSVFSGLLFVALSSLLWFLGIHGSDVLEGVSLNLWVPAFDANTASIAAGSPATEIFTKHFFDAFVLMGGCGSTFCLLVAILIFSKHSGNRSLAKMAALPMLFNINEIMIFGLPVVFNPILFVPFLLTPIVSLLIAYFATYFGLVPLITSSVAWTTPIFIGGYAATGSVAGALLQLVNLVVGVAIYRPFVRMYDSEKMSDIINQLNELVKVVKESEDQRTNVSITQMNNAVGSVAKMLAIELPGVIEKSSFSVYYQPQYNSCDECIGAEALLRWIHPQFGLIYPPLVIKLAEEIGLLLTLEEAIIQKVATDIPRLKAAIGAEAKISVNVSGKTMQEVEFVSFLSNLIEDEVITSGDIWIEITEQMAYLGDVGEGAFVAIREMGFPMVLDDFSMGHTSLKYLQSSQFDMVKLDGVIVRGMESNPRCADIISSIVFLSQSLNFSVLAEYVETIQQRDALIEIGCRQFQGYLYSPAVPIDVLEVANVNR